MRLVIFDVDGTLIDSQNNIVASAEAAFAALSLAAPARADVLRLVGLSLPETMVRLAPTATQALRDDLVQAYKDSFRTMRLQGHDAPMFPGARDAVLQLAGAPGTMLAIATGKSRRGLEAMLDQHELRGLFHSTQVADDHPSKPHPSMVLAALAETGVAARHAVMVGDTSFDMDMAAAAGVRRIAVGWGYHAPELLVADHHISRFDELAPIFDQMTELADG
ncbi:HAD family hydrolase [Ketogulonicigenium vulgare]|uniref:Hydrolase, haloacid dehalogenase-like protein family protein n=1 Tax=Ketogulonicigenium vulgare (strain WSH-001) TaxID=759362 RepID=F9Y5A5_KETVW|nr:HAD family hydrolase [Ketogulonicigenium vulgare]ADO43642.1 HAD-superfamily hydrolase, subfamily IA, variant 1 [Ketogulonicigenium vulgare Y25]AEM41910.1 Hydrolase, haloacid dehalogenase-like protein family protein [Ketogulonicigenium vulgare WSH-001]ALJ82013.1 HAD family hydrolase [Ketogulonicigenium vulgare]ANW34648.1 HAD family hydrolase [Ketogulonicigenium vulgare]AOZ55674.1 HAD-superfamily hydrolase, subfamily IA, variant 1 [Ketogulonicigenium vulgare]